MKPQDTNTDNNALKVIVIDDSFGAIASHWAYSTPNLQIIGRVRHDLDSYEKELLDVLPNFRPDVLAYSGKGAAVAASRARYIFNRLREKNNDHPFCRSYLQAIEVARIQNTNIQHRLPVHSPDVDFLKSFPNVWLQMGISYPFDLLMIQTDGDDLIINDVLKANSAHYIPFAYNEHLFHPINTEKHLDIGMFFKVERHAYRIPFIETINEIANRHGWKTMFSEQYWGKAYVEALCSAKIILHYSKYGDVPYRLYEVAGCRGCLLTDKLSYGIEKLFSTGIHFCEFERDLSDLEDKLFWLLQDQTTRESIAMSAYEHSTKNHTWNSVAERLIVPLLRQRLAIKKQHSRITIR
ncbi:MAG: glycosyltransferase [bacterium]